MFCYVHKKRKCIHYFLQLTRARVKYLKLAPMMLVLKPLVQVKTQNVVVIIICFVMIGSNYFFETDAQQTPLLSSSLSLSSLSLIDTLFHHHDLSVSSFLFYQRTQDFKFQHAQHYECKILTTLTALSFEKQFLPK